MTESGYHGSYAGHTNAVSNKVHFMFLLTLYESHFCLTVKPQQAISPYKKPTAPVMSTPVKGQRTPVSFTSKSPELKTKTEDSDLTVRPDRTVMPF